MNLHKYLSSSYNFILCRDTISSHFLRYQFAVNNFAMSKCIIQRIIKAYKRPLTDTNGYRCHCEYYDLRVNLGGSFEFTGRDFFTRYSVVTILE